MNKLVIVISGQIVRENSANLKNFWRGFINIQNAIYNIDELKIVGHSWNPEFDNLVKSVYNIDILESEKQNSFVKEYMSLLNPVDKFENGFKRAKSTWHKVNPNMMLGQITSKTKSIKLLKKMNLSEDDIVISTRWDIGCSGGKEVNQLIFDSSLNTDYLYLAYFPYVDEGYADMWYWGKYKYLKKFEVYKEYFLNVISDQNSFFDDFTKNGWKMSLPVNLKRTKVELYKKLVLTKILKLFPFELFKRIFPFLFNKLIGLKSRLVNFIEFPVITGENSLLLNTNLRTTYGIPESLNIHGILKSFIFDNNLRESTRFLDIKDFENLPNGQMINPVEFCYVIYSHSSFEDCWKMAINQAKENLPKNCKKIYLVSENSQDTTEKYEKYKQDGVKLVTYNGEIKYTDRLIEVFSKINTEFNNCYFVHEDMPLVSPVNQVYLNTLLHYINNSNEFYIKLVDTNYVDEKFDHESFPNLVKNMGGYSISVQPLLMKLDFMINFLTNFHQDIYGFEQLCMRTNFTFSAVKGTKKIGKYLLPNEYFPHIATAISKGKWCTSEWKNEINYLAQKYDIDISIRGEC